MGVPSFGNLRIEAYLQLPAAYRSLSRPSSAPDAKAFTLCSCSLELLFVLTILVLISAELLEFLQIKFGIIFSRERFFPFTLLSYSTSVKSFLPLLERPILEFLLSLYSSLKSVLLSVRFYSYFALFGFQ